jgi:hypothetical protein
MLTPFTTPARWSSARRYVVAVAAATAGIAWTHALAAIIRSMIAPDAPPMAVGLSVVSIGLAVVGCALLPSRLAEVAVAAWGSVTVLAFAIMRPEGWVPALALVPVGVAVTAGARWLGGRLPDWIDLAPWRRWAVATAWALLALTSVVQVARLATAMTDHDRGFVLTTTNPFWYGHECFGAYLYAAEMSARGEPNVYHASHYPGLDPEAEPRSSLEGVALEDPYQYPPQFLLLPHAVLAMTDDVEVIRVMWFALQMTLFVAVAASLGLWVGGTAGRLALWLIPGVLASFPVLHNLQFGQFHLPAVALAVAGLLAVERRRDALGGLLLATAVLAKVFPVVLLAYLVGRLRLRAVVWTAVFGVAWTMLALAVLGPAPFEAFVHYQLPRLSDGSAFAFDVAWPELADLVMVDNQGVFGLVRKLGFEVSIAATAGRVFGLAVIALALIVGCYRPHEDRGDRASVWLALLGLASLASPGAWGDYVPVTAVWLLTLVTAVAPRTAGWRLFLVTVWTFQFLLLGTMPIGDWTPIVAMRIASGVGAVLMLGLFLRVTMSPVVDGSVSKTASVSEQSADRLARAA